MERETERPPSEPNELPFVATCKSLTWRAPFRWLQKGFSDLAQAYKVSLLIGALMTLPIVLSVVMAWSYGGIWLILAMLIGFVFAAPVGCISIYAISAQLERGLEVSIARTFRASFNRTLGTAMVFALVLLIIFLIWVRAGSAVSVFLPAEQTAEPQGKILYALILAAVSSVFLTITFAVSAFSLPMIMHRNVDAITAVVTSVNAVLRNKLVLAIWAACIMVAMLVGVLSGGLGLIVLLPVIGHAAWHAYLETIDAPAFPRHDFGITATARSL